MVSSCQDQELVGLLPVELSLLLCKFLSCESCSLQLLPSGVTILNDRLVVPSSYTTFSNNQKMVSVLHKELEHEYCM